MEAFLARLSELAGRHPWRWIAVWLVLFMSLGYFAGKAQDKLSNGGFNVPGSQSQQVVDYFQNLQSEGSQPFTFLVVAPTTAEARARAAAALAVLRRNFQIVKFTIPPFASRDGKAIAATGYAPLDQNKALALAARLKRSLQVTTGQVRTYVLGPAATYDTFQKITEKGLARAELFAAIPLVIVLLLVFGAVVAAAVPLLMAVLSVSVAFGITYFAASNTEVSIFATTMISMIGIGVAVDYSMFILARFREELRAGREVPRSVRTAMATSGTAVVFSGLTVIVSLMSILLVPVRAVQSMAAAAATVTLVAVLAAATFLPALLHLLGHRVNKLQLVDWEARAARNPDRGFWHRWVARIMERPVVAFVLAAGFLLLLTVPALRLHTQNTSLDQIPSADPIRVGSALLTDRITGPGRGREGAITVLIRTPAEPAALTQPTEALARRLASLPHVTSATVDPPLPDGYAIIVETDADPEGELSTNTIVPAVRRLVAADPIAARAEVDVGGVGAFQRDLNEEVGGDLWKVIVFVVVLAYLVLLVLLRSVLLPLKAVIMNLLSIGAAYGVVVMVFQWGWFDFAGFHSQGHIGTLNPPLILAITFGLSMDYEVFLLSRIKERYELHGSNERAVAEGIASSARIITSAAGIMAIVFGAFVLTGLPTIKEIGLGLAVAIVIDATITRLVLVPATMRLLGEWNWWLPGWLGKMLPHVAHETARPV
jgi:RND superfamily putative drug exporter